MNYLGRFFVMSCIVLSSLSYQRAFAGANGFVAKKARNGDTLVSLLRQQGFSDKEREKIFSQAPSIQQLFLQLDVSYLIKRDTTGTEMRLYHPQKDLVFWIKKDSQGIQARTGPANFKTYASRYQGKVQGSLMNNILALTPSNWVASRFMDAYIMDYNLNKGLARNAPFSYTVEKKYDGPYFIRYGEVLQTSLNIRDREVQKRFIRIGGDGGVFISENDMLKNRPFYSPVNYLRVASLFQPNRRHPVTHRVQPHMGVDFEMPEGTPIYAARKGIVIRYGTSHAAGNYVVLLHGRGVETSYNHMRRVDAKIRRGLVLNVGEKLGEVGCTGYCTKAHLHFAVRQNGRMVDPLKYLRPYPVYAENLLHSKVAQF